MLRNISFLLVFFPVLSLCHAPRLKFLLENPQNIEHARPYFKGSFSIFSKTEGILDFSSGELEKLEDIEIQSVFKDSGIKMSLEVLSKDSDNLKKFKVSDSSLEGSLLKSIISSLVYNESSLFSFLLNLDSSDEIDQEIVDYLENYLLEFEKNKLEAEKENSDNSGDELTPEVELKDISSTSQEKEQEALPTIEEILQRKFYNSAKNLSVEMCNFGPCLIYISEKYTLVFSREFLNLRKIQFAHGISNEELINVSINFDNYQKVGGRYNFPKSIILDLGNKNYLIKLNSYYLSKRSPSINVEELDPLIIKQIF